MGGARLSGGDAARDAPGDAKRPTAGSAAGDAHDPNLYGEATSIAARRTREEARGRGGQPTRSETIRRSSEKGFASQSYRKVFSDYTSVAEEAIEKERVPPGYRYLVKRYFQLIRPRE